MDNCLKLLGYALNHLPDHQLSAIGDHHFILMLWLMFSELVNLFKTIVHMEFQNVRCFFCFSITTKVNQVPFFFIMNLTVLTFSFTVLQFLICMYCTYKVIHKVLFFVLFCGCYGFIWCLFHQLIGRQRNTLQAGKLSFSVMVFFRLLSTAEV